MNFHLHSLRSMYVCACVGSCAWWCVIIVHVNICTRVCSSSMYVCACLGCCARKHLYLCLFVSLRVCGTVFIIVHVLLHEMVVCACVCVWVCACVCMWMCVYVDVCVCGYVHVFVCGYVHVFACGYVHVFTCGYVHVFACGYVHVGMYVCLRVGSGHYNICMWVCMCVVCCCAVCTTCVCDLWKVVW